MIVIKFIMLESDAYQSANAFLPMELWDDYGLDAANIIVLALAMIVMTTVDIMLYREKDVIEKLEKVRLPIRWTILYILIFATIVVGVYGPGYDVARFIYYKF